MKITILGCTGSLGGPDGPASGYLLQPAGQTPVLMDFGPGCLARLQGVHNPSDAHVMFSHLHADHSMDFPSLMVWRRYHPTMAAPGRNLLAAPTDAPDRLGRVSADMAGEVDDFSDTFAFTPWVAHTQQLLGGLGVIPYPAIHPIEAYSLRCEDLMTGKIFAYSGDTDFSSELVAAARDADLFFCEATWGLSSEGKAPAMHMSGREAGIAAREAGVKHLVLVHMPPWVDPLDAKRAAAEEYSGPITIGEAGMVVEL